MLSLQNSFPIAKGLQVTRVVRQVDLPQLGLELRFAGYAHSLQGGGEDLVRDGRQGEQGSRSKRLCPT